jgi:hypothetical protein
MFQARFWKASVASLAIGMVFACSSAQSDESMRAGESIVAVTDPAPDTLAPLGDPDGPFGTACAVDADCASGQSCDTVAGICVVPLSNYQANCDCSACNADPTTTQITCPATIPVIYGPADDPNTPVPDVVTLATDEAACPSFCTNIFVSADFGTKVNPVKNPMLTWNPAGQSRVYIRFAGTSDCVGGITKIVFVLSDRDVEDNIVQKPYKTITKPQLNAVYTGTIAYDGKPTGLRYVLGGESAVSLSTVQVPNPDGKTYSLHALFTCTGTRKVVPRGGVDSTEIVF